MTLKSSFLKVDIIATYEKMGERGVSTRPAAQSCNFVFRNVVTVRGHGFEARRSHFLELALDGF